MTKEYKLYQKPLRHIIIESEKKIHGWWPWRYRECTAERLLLNPYAGCSIDCIFCYTKGFPGYFKIFFAKKIISVWINYPQSLSKQLDRLKIASCGYLSPVTDPFQRINQEYKLSEKIIFEFVKRKIPIEVVTKANIPKEVIELLKLNPHNFAQISIITIKEDLRKKLIKGEDAAAVNELFKNIRILRKEGVYTVCRIDPIFPYLTDSKDELEEIVKRAVDGGANHVVASCLDLPISIKNYLLESFEDNIGGLRYLYKKLYTESLNGYLHAKTEYREKLFYSLREICDKYKITLGLCMEFKKTKEGFEGMNKYFSNVSNCEGIDIPLYKKTGKYFEPIAACNGSCLNCKVVLCKIEDIIKSKIKAFKYSDYLRWSKKCVN